jgi:hypothetical protein
MPVDRYRDVGDMPPPARLSGNELLQAMAAVWEQAHISLPPDFPRGLFKYPSLQAAQDDRHQREMERVRRLRRDRISGRGAE